MNDMWYRYVCVCVCVFCLHNSAVLHELDLHLLLICSRRPGVQSKALGANLYKNIDFFSYSHMIREVSLDCYALFSFRDVIRFLRNQIRDWILSDYTDNVSRLLQLVLTGEWVEMLCDQTACLSEVNCTLLFRDRHFNRPTICLRFLLPHSVWRCIIVISFEMIVSIVLSWMLGEDSNYITSFSLDGNLV